MSVDMIDLLIGQKLADDCVGLAGLGERGLDHQSMTVERAQRQDPAVEHRRHLVDEIWWSTIRNEDGVTGVVRPALMADVVEQKHLLANIPILQGHPAREARL